MEENPNDGEESGFSIFPVSLPRQPSFPTSALHYMYLRPHSPKLPDPDSARSLFVVNIPIISTELHFKHLFGTQLAAGKVEKVEFQDQVRSTALPPAPKQPPQNRKKRRQTTAEELEIKLEGLDFPATWDRQLHKSGSNAVIVFVDRASMLASLKAAKTAAQQETTLRFGEGIEDKLPSLGSKSNHSSLSSESVLGPLTKTVGYITHSRLQYPEEGRLLRHINEYMEVYAELESTKAQERARQRQVPDEDGFIMVTKGGRNGPARQEEISEVAARQKEKNKGLDDFYRFQQRQKNKERQTEMLRAFEDDKRKLAEMKN